MRPVIAVFAKAPVPGRVKTRLCPPLSYAGAARLHEALVRRLLERLRGWPVELHTDRETDAWTCARRLQCAGDLGERMLYAFREGTRMIVGSDAPTVPLEHLNGLLRSEADVALGPAEDGGYYAIACRRWAEGMFAGVRWSTEHALDDTVAACRQAGLSVELGPSWYDVDSAPDLERLLADPEARNEIRRILEEER